MRLEDFRNLLKCPHGKNSFLSKMKLIENMDNIEKLRVLRNSYYLSRQKLENPNLQSYHFLTDLIKQVDKRISELEVVK